MESDVQSDLVNDPMTREAGRRPAKKRRQKESPQKQEPITHMLHVWYIIYANIWGILMVNVSIYTIHGSYG